MNYLDKPNLTKITSEIHFFNEQGIRVSIEVGKRLEEAKHEFQSSDEWLNWAESEFGYKKSQIYKLVSIAKRFHSSGNILEGKTINEVYALTAFSDDELETPTKLPSGEEKKPIEMNQREIEQYKKSLKEAERRIAEAEATAETAQNSARHYEKLFNSVKNQPPRIETRTVQVVPEDYSLLKEQANNAQRLNAENVKLQRELMQQKEEYETRLTKEDRRKAINRELQKACKELLQNHAMYAESILYQISLSAGEREASQILEAFLLQYSNELQSFFNKTKQLTTVKTVS